MTVYQVNPIWILINDEIQNVSDYTDLRPSDRPEAHCPVCLTPVTMKLGKKRAHHFAHKPDQECVLSDPESALHFNVKYYLFQQLQTTNVIFTDKVCYHCRDKSERIILISNWDTVQMEYTVDNFRPDIALISDGLVIGAIEVYVTHSIDVIKKKFYDEKSIGWIEVNGSEEIYQSPTQWTSDQPFPHLRASAEIKNWLCDECRELIIKEDLERQKRAKKERNNRKEIYTAMMVDYFYPSGKKYREKIWIRREMKNGVWVRAYVMVENNLPLMQVYGRPINDSQIEELKQAAQEHINSKKNRSRGISDIVADWQLWIPGQKFHSADLGTYPFQYRWNSNTKRWHKIGHRDDISKGLSDNTQNKSLTIQKVEHPYAPTEVEHPYVPAEVEHPYVPTEVGSNVKYKVVDSYYPDGRVKREVYIRNDDKLTLDTGELIIETKPISALNSRLESRRKIFKAMTDDVTDWLDELALQCQLWW